MVVTSPISLDPDSFKASITPRPDLQTNDMDVPKITVFKSPPWTKPDIKSRPVPKISDIYEEFPTNSKMFNTKRMTAISRSLECIPENTVLQDTHTYSTTHLRDHRLSPHMILPPISPSGSPTLRENDVLPEMRQRAYSDPHRYRRKSDDKKESPLAHRTIPESRTPLSPDLKLSKTKVSPLTQNGPLKAKPPTSPNKDNSGLKADLRVKSRRTSLSKRESGDRATPLNARQRKPSHGSGDPVSSSEPLPKSRLSSELKHPVVNGLRCEGYRDRTNSLPKSKKEIMNRKPDRVEKTVAFALVGSPGRERWPSPERQATSYMVDSDSASDPSSRNNSMDSIQDSAAPINSTASKEFKSILRAFTSNSYSSCP